jgi:ribosomal protein S6--L-glutamate ligase
MAPRVITDHASLAAAYEELAPGDIIIGRLRLSPGEEHVLLDLAARGVKMMPSAVSQLCSRSKVFQARILKKFMVPGTEPVYSLHELMEMVSAYGRMSVGRVVCKLDRANAGTGILLFGGIEDVYSQAALGNLTCPFVVQPFVAGCRDVRVVVLGEYVEAYIRHNPDNFRQNLHCGGGSTPLEVDDALLAFCRRVMERADFPYGTLDLLISGSGDIRLNEINLRGGLRGAKITQEDYLEAVRRIHNAFAGNGSGRK